MHSVFRKFLVVYWPLILFSVVFLLLTFTNPFSDHHVLYNLEPYPDGLLYVGSAFSLLRHGQFFLSLNGYLLKPRITPLYPMFLAVGYIFSSQPAFFYVTNIFIGSLTLLFLFWTLRQITHSRIALFFGLLIYAVHGYIYWIPSVPMAENLSLFIFVMMLWFVLKKKIDWGSVVGAAVTISALVLTKYTLVLPAGVCALFFYWRLWKGKEWKKIGAISVIFFLLAIAFLMYQAADNYDPFGIFSKKTFNQPSPVTGTVFYSFKFFVPNLIAYGRNLLGLPQNFLWLRYAFTSAGIFFLFSFGQIQSFLRKKNVAALFFLLVFLSQLPLLLVFYVADARYLIITLPLFAVGLAQSFEENTQKWFRYAMIGAVILQILLQASFVKYLIATNWLNRSVAWQYEATKILDQELPHSQQTYIITALPPLLFDFYFPHQYRLLPLTSAQEFVNKKHFIWGQDVNYNNLFETYEKVLKSHQNLYLTNAYLTSQVEFAPAFAAIQQHFSVTKISDGCLGTCNLYQVREKP